MLPPGDFLEEILLFSLSDKYIAIFNPIIDFLY